MDMLPIDIIIIIDDDDKDGGNLDTPERDDAIKVEFAPE